MLTRLPKGIPPLDDMLHDIGSPTAEALAKALGVSRRTAYRWIARGDDAPRVARLAIFWLTQWGQSVVECEAVNTTRLYVGYANSLQREVQQLREQLRKLGEIGSFGSVNDPAPGVVGGAGPAAPALTFPPIAFQEASDDGPDQVRTYGPTGRTTAGRTGS
jgi:hypothetical protein